jgi:dynein light chain LC8-type
MAKQGGLTVKSAEIKNADIEEEVAQDLIQLCIDTMTKVPKEALMAPIIKREMDKRYSPTWHVFIGKVCPALRRALSRACSRRNSHPRRLHLASHPPSSVDMAGQPMSTP